MGSATSIYKSEIKEGLAELYARCQPPDMGAVPEVILLSGEPLPVELSQSACHVADLRQSISSSLKVPYWRVRLLANSEVLKEDSALDSLTTAVTVVLLPSLSATTSGKNAICTGARGLVHALCKGSIVTWRLNDCNAATELSDIHVHASVGCPVGLIAADPEALEVYAVGNRSEGQPGEIFCFRLGQKLERDLRAAPCGRHLRTLSGHSLRVTHLLWIMGVGLVSGSEDGTCRLWDAAGGHCIVYSTGRTVASLGDEAPEKVTALAAEENLLFVANQRGGIDAVRFEGSPPRSSQAVTVLPLWMDRGTDVDAKRAHFNFCCRLAALSAGCVAAGTLSGEVVLANLSGHNEAVHVFENSFVASLIAVNCLGEVCIFVGNGGFNTQKYEVVMLGQDPLRVLKRIWSTDMNVKIDAMHWADESNTLLIAADDKGVFAFSPQEDEAPRPVFFSEEDRDTMDNEVVRDFAEVYGIVHMVTSFGRVRRFTATDFAELDPLKPVSQFGVKGQAKISMDRSAGSLVSIRSGYDEYRLDSVNVGDLTWTRHSLLPNLEGGMVEVLKGGEPSGGMGYPGHYRVQVVTHDSAEHIGAEMTLVRADLEGLLLLGKGWPPDFVKVLELPDECITLVGGELGGLIQYDLTTCRAHTFIGGKPILEAGEINRAVLAACATWDSNGTLMAVGTRGVGPCVYDLKTRQHLGNLPAKDRLHMAITRIPQNDAMLPLVASADNQGIVIWDLRACTVFQLVQTDLPGPVRCLLGCVRLRSCIVAFSAATQKSPEGQLSVLPLTVPAILESPEAGPPSLALGQVARVTSMVYLEGIGLLAAHSPIAQGISVWCLEMCRQICTVWPADAGVALYIHLGPGTRCVMWSAVGGRVGFLKWADDDTVALHHVEDCQLEALL